MCGRFALKTPPDRLAELFDAEIDPPVAESWSPSWNLAKTDPVLAITSDAQERRTLVAFRWGLVPWFVDDPTKARQQINAKAETLDTERVFRSAFARRRALIPADGYFEWTGPKAKRQPWYFHRPDDSPFVFAGLYEVWRDRRTAADPEGTLCTCTIITTEPSEDLASIHDRMPALLVDPDLFEVWLDPRNDDVDELKPPLRPPPAGTLTYHPVNRRVNKATEEGPDLIEPVALGDQPALFAD